MERLFNIPSGLLAYRDIDLRCAPMARMLRRDWSVVSAHLHYTIRHGDFKQRLDLALDELQVQADDLMAQMSIPFLLKLDSSWLNPVTMRFPIVNRQMKRCLKIIEQVDQSYATLITATREGIITRQRQSEMIAPVHFVYANFKAIAMRKPLKTYEQAD